MLQLIMLHRKENNTYFLDVYSPENLWGFVISTRRIRNPVCIIEDGNPWVDNMCLLDRRQVLSWESENSTLGNTVHYSLSKAVFRIISENEGYVTCRAFVADTFNEIVTKRQLFRSDDKGLIFAVALKKWINGCPLTLCEPTYSLQKWQSLAEDLSQRLKKYKEFSRITVRPIRMSERTENTITLIFRIKIFSEAFQGEIETDHYHLNKLNSIFKGILSSNSDGLTDVLYVRSTKFCHEEEAYGNKILHWPVATIGQTVLPSELCVDGEGVPVHRQCIGDFVVGAFWFDQNKNNRTLYKCEVPSLRASFLHNLSLQAERNQDATKTLKKLQFALTSQDTRKFGNVTHFTPAEIQYAANTLANLKHRILYDSDLPVIANITDALLRLSVNETDINFEENNMTHKVTNASNIILDSVDHMLNKIKLNYKEMSLVVTPRFVTLVMDVETNSKAKGGLQGLAAVKASKYSNKYFKKEDIMIMSWNESVETLLALEVSAAVLLPPQLTLEQTEDTCDTFHLKTCNSSEVLRKHRLVINLFWDDSFFASNNVRIRRPLHVMSITLDGVKHTQLNPPLMLIFHRPRNILPQDRECVFWDFDANSRLGRWSDIGCTPAVKLSGDHTVKTDVCICTHLTHFGQLLSPIAEKEVDVTLDIITIVGCSISLFGLFGIAVTAIAFPDWRHGASKKIQLHLSASLGILMSVFLLNASLFIPPNESQFCLVLGVAMHFSLMATFCWMLVVAWFQYLRLTKPLTSLCRTPHILLKTTIFAWGFPFVPCGTLLIVSPDSYNSPQCYPKGMAHYLSVIAPVSIIMSLNIVMFVLITCSIYKLGKIGVHANCELQFSNKQQCKQSIAYRKLSTLIFLFFLLGLSWIFGIWKLSYLFCCTATLQGFAFFVFFVILEKNTRAKWSHLFTKKKSGPVYHLCNRNSSVLVVKRSYEYKRTSQNTVSTSSSLS
ncbi:adhesion G-protein coupled receptor G2-like isoform X2 [Zootermopsis nevadensis]|uniref:adhesion G-protein coupled receptor G2-like isoform X2 n=1 Tax=Zootermopsis nevadensis TaxID=136037 RepID=UPI000B8E2954|nr:adhesion G-protein coupled receptor G2-like isoform X2 [Zootermopsis nevadensis]